MKNRTYRYFEGTPLYPFGYGLTYGKCSVKDVDVELVKDDKGEFAGAKVTATVVNEGKRDTDEYNANRSHLLQYDGNYIELATDQFRYDLDEFDRMRAADGVILKLRSGKDKTEAMDKVVYTLQKQDIKIVGVME